MIKKIINYNSIKIQKIQADILGYGWRAPYVLAALPGIVLALLLATTVKV